MYDIQEPAKSVLNIAKMKEQYQAKHDDLTGTWLSKNHIKVLEVNPEDFSESNIVDLGDTGVSVVINLLTDGSIGIGFFVNDDDDDNP